MKEEQDYINDLAEIRSMMERSSKFLSLSGWAGVLAGIYALIAGYIAHAFLHFQPESLSSDMDPALLRNIAMLATLVLLLALITAIVLSSKRATKRSESLWNDVSRRLIGNIALPLVSGGLLMIISALQGFPGLLAPLSLVFYGLALFNAGNYAYKELRVLGIIQVVLGLAACCFVNFGLLFWALGFGLLHITYGLYIHSKYQR